MKFPVLLFSGTLLFLLSSCVPKYVQIYPTKAISDNINSFDGNWIYCDSLIEIDYEFNSDGGYMNIINLSRKPLFINWSKSSMTINSVNFSYLNEESYVRSPEKPYDPEKDLTSAAYSNEQRTFIPPESRVIKYCYQYLQEQLRSTEIDSTVKYDTVLDGKKYSYLKGYLKHPFEFRNYITYYDINSGKENIIDHEFEVTEAYQVKNLRSNEKVIAFLKRTQQNYFLSNVGFLFTFSDREKR